MSLSCKTRHRVCNWTKRLITCASLVSTQRVFASLWNPV